MKTLMLAKILNHGSIDVTVGVGENKRSDTLSAFVYVHYILLKKALKFLAILGIVWETFLKNRNCCNQLAGSLSCLS